MRRDLAELGSRTFDLLVIGGGITGAFLALDAAGRGLSVALVEKGDFGAATSAASSKLLHGGIRYLQHGRPAKVRESARERAHLLNLAPYLCRWVPFVIPTSRGLRRSRTALRVALGVYDRLCREPDARIRDAACRVPPTRVLSRGEVEALVPGGALPGITGGALLWEAHMQSSERMTLAVLASATSRGAVLANHLRAEELLVAGDRVVGARVRETLPGAGAELEVRARVVANAAGPWIPEVGRGPAGRKLTGVVHGLAYGAHVVTRSLTQGHAFALTTARPHQALLGRGGRHVFIIPWRGHSLVGTTWAPWEGPRDAVAPGEGDVRELLADVNAALGEGFVSRDDVRWAFAGLYPLVGDFADARVYRGASDSEVVDHAAADGLQGLVTVFGAKFTTARLVAERAADLVAERYFEGKPEPCATRTTPLDAGAMGDLAAFRRDLHARWGRVLPPASLDPLVASYGTQAEDVARRVERSPELGTPLAPDRETLAAAVVHAVEEEMALRLDDVVFRRTGLGTLGDPGPEAIGRAADLMGARLGWDAERRCEEMERVAARFVPRPE